MEGAEVVLSLGHWGMFDVTGCDMLPWVYGEVRCGKWELFRGEDLDWF